MDVASRLNSVLGTPLKGGGSELRWCCPFDHSKPKVIDDNYHLYFNTKKTVYYCQRCGRGGSLDSLLKFLGVRIKIRLSDWDDIVEDFMATAVEEEEEVDDAIHLPCPVMKIRPGRPAFRYLVDERGYDPKVISQYNIKVGTGDWKHWVIIPDYDQGGLAYWVARYIGDPSEGRPKTRNPGGVKRSRYVFGLSRAVKEGVRRLIIVEGPTDYLAVGRGAVATLGVHFTATQVRLLCDADVDQYVVSFDGDASKDSMKLASMLKSSGREVHLAKLPYGEDPASLCKKDRAYYQRLIDGAAPYTVARSMKMMMR